MGLCEKFTTYGEGCTKTFVSEWGVCKKVLIFWKFRPTLPLIINVKSLINGTFYKWLSSKRCIFITFREATGHGLTKVKIWLFFTVSKAFWFLNFKILSEKEDSNNKYINCMIGKDWNYTSHRETGSEDAGIAIAINCMPLKQ